MDNRTNILACALRLLAARGYEAVSVQEICEAAGITKPTLYHYFESKRGLLDALLAEHFGPLMMQVRQAADYHGDLPLTLDRTAAAYFEYARQHGMFYRLQLALWFAPVNSEAFAAVSASNQAQFDLIEELFHRAAQNHGNMIGRQRAYAATFLGMVNNYIALSLNGYMELNDALRYQAVHQFMHGIFS